MARTYQLLAPLLLLPLISGCATQAGSSTATPAASAPRQVFVANEKERRFEFGRRLRFMLGDQEFRQLEAMADSLQTSGECWPSGRPKIETFYANGFSEVDDLANATEWETLLAGLRQWYDASPQSPVASIALAEALIARAWAARGHGWGDSVTDEQWRRFYHDLDEAGQLLNQAPSAARDLSEWHFAMMRVLHGMGQQADAGYWVEAKESLGRFPARLDLYTNAANHLLPRWYGAEGQWEKFADEATRQLPDSIADEYYARIVLYQSQVMRNVFDESPGLSWGRVEHGLRMWQAHCPRSLQPKSALANLACLAGKHDIAQQTFQSLGDTLELEIWDEGKVYWNFRAWAEHPLAVKPS